MPMFSCVLGVVELRGKTGSGGLASSMSGRDRRNGLCSILTHLPHCSKHPAFGSGELLGLLVSLSLGRLCMTEAI